MEYEQIKKLINDMGESKIDELKLEFPDGIKINMKKNVNSSKVQEETPPVMKQEVVQTIETKIENPDNENYKIVKSPMVGTFYSKSTPTEESFVKVGQKVKKGDTLCIIEAMKLMNEIESEVDGEIAEICFKDEEMVEYGATLFKIK